MSTIAAEPLQIVSLAQYGFAGALLSDARAAPQVNAAFTPADAVIELARQQAEAYDAARAEGAWVARLGKQVVDAHTARKARQVLE